MQKTERLRDAVIGTPGSDYFEKKQQEGWKLVAVEWERGSAVLPERPREEVPYGLKVSEDCLYLVENDSEKEILAAMLELLIADRSMSDVAETLNQRGYRMRKGTPWTAVAVFDLLPRIVEMAPRIYPGRDWSERRRKIYALGS
jgi:hypothetical protein